MRKEIFISMKSRTRNAFHEIRNRRAPEIRDKICLPISTLTVHLINFSR